MDIPPLAYHDHEFLESSDARPLRMLAEYLDPLRRFRAHNIQDTVVFFGSARVHSRLVARRALARVHAGASTRTAEYKAELKRRKKALAWSRYYEDARALARQLTKWSMGLEATHRR